MNVDLTDCSGEARSHHKKRRQDEDPPDAGDCPATDAPIRSPQQSSYRDKLLGDRSRVSPNDEDFLDEEDIDLNEGDVIRGMENGLIKIDFSDRVHALAVKSLEQTIVIKILGRRIGYTTLRNKLYEIWQPSQAFKLMDIENDYFLVTFRSRSDYLHVLTDGPWLVYGHYVSVESWTEDFSTAQPYPGNIIAWIRLPGLPVTFYKRSLITALGECIGSVLKLDYQTETGCRGKFARMAVRINLNQPLVSKIVVNGKVQLVEYESLPTVCFNCGKYGHMNENCPDQQPAPSTEVPLQPSEPLPPTPSTMYGPWMVVEKRQRRPLTRVAVGDNNALGANVTASRFAPIFDSSVDVSAPMEVSRPPTTISTAASKRIFKAKHVPTKQVPTTQKHKGKATSAVNVRKPLQINLADFPILPRSSHKAGPSTHLPSSKVSFRLDGNKHSSISLPENSDPNISASGSSLRVSNVPGEPPQKPPDPPLSASKTMGQAEEVPSRDMQFSARLADASGMISDGQVSAMIE
ncbi:hypothetical protein V6N12_052779 [Hibiscus sabdariffa]|uniref:CCHC-type domain-containing protein n=1 Tax=Hibiscus sabdariffa TaxID=183260 RepID=A0ABR2C2J5_9ROSI